MTGQQIIDKFHIYTGDQSDLSTQEEIDLMNKVYDDILNQIPYEFLKKSYSGTIISNGDGTGYMDLPEDFRYFIENNLQTDNSSRIDNNASPKVVFVGANYIPYQIVNWSDRRQYRGRNDVCYLELNITGNKVIFPVMPNETSAEFDYIKQWDALTLSNYPIFPADLHDMIFQGMAIDSVIINLFDKARSYAKENTDAYNDMLRKLKYYNSMLIQN